MRKVFLSIALILMLFVTAGCFRVIESGEVGVKKTLGKIDDIELTEGLKFYMPIISFIEIHNVKTQEQKETAEVPTIEGLIITLDTSVLYHLDASMAAEMRKTVTGDYRTTLLVPFIRNSIRDTVSGYEAKSIYSEEGRQEVAIKIKASLVGSLEPRGIIIEHVLLRDVKLPLTVKAAIEDKIDAEQKAQKKEFELLSAIKDAEIRVVDANGIAEANNIIADSLTEAYLTYTYLRALEETSNRVIYVPTEGGTPLLTLDTTS